MWCYEFYVGSEFISIFFIYWASHIVKIHNTLSKFKIQFGLSQYITQPIYPSHR